VTGSRKGGGADPTVSIDRFRDFRWVGVSIQAIAFVEVVSGAPGAAEPKEKAMSLTTAPTVTATAYAATRSGSLPRTTVVAGLVAAAVTTGAAAAVHAAGVSYQVDAKMIPLAGFAQMTFLGAVIGGLLLAVLNLRSRSARTRFVQTAVVLTALSCVPPVALADDVASKLGLVALHVLAAAIVVPALSRHAHD
jgi:peptidoglycan/LPS O-acetylase OafA/YrhL